jgi:predicted lipoprotein with Yx(FWY)xxD motif
MRTLTALLVSLAAAVAVGGAWAVPTASTATASTLTARSSNYGTILFDGRGFALYAFTKDAKGPSRCYGDCAKAWPPLLVKKRALAGMGTRSSLVGTTKRRDGKLQATYAGRPLYYYVGDKRRGQVLCQDVAEFGGTWLVVRPSGRLVR